MNMQILHRFLGLPRLIATGGYRRLMRRGPSSLTKEEIKKLVVRPDPIIVEIGAADGLDTLEFLQTFPDAHLRMYCFEPDPRNVATFKSKVNDPRVELIESAVGDQDGTTTFHQSSTIYSSSLKAPNVATLQAQWPEISFGRDLQVPVTTLDTFLRDRSITRVDFAWVDVQGAEDLVLRGARHSLKHAVRYLYTEYSNVAYYQNEPNLQQILSALGPNWKVIRDYKSEVLLKNILLTQ